MGKDIRDPAGMNEEDLFEAFGLLDLHQQKLDKTPYRITLTYLVQTYFSLIKEQLLL